LKEPAFWDISALLFLCTKQPSKNDVELLYQRYDVVAWWATPVEARSSLARLVRMLEIDRVQRDNAIDRFEELRMDWTEIGPSESLRYFAEGLPDRFALRAGDALQLAAAYTWTMQRPTGRPFISGDKRLLDAADQLGFRTIAV
jgi:predicted nucleic acid-binding protein